MTTLDATEARTRLHNLIAEAAQTHGPIKIVEYRLSLKRRSTTDPWRESE